MSSSPEQTLALNRLYWKELRTQGVIWLALFAMCVLMAVAGVVLAQAEDLSTAIKGIVFAGPLLFGLASGSFAFAIEDEMGTIQVLRRLPVTSRDVLRAKFGFSLVGLVLFLVAIFSVAGLLALLLRPGQHWQLGHWYFLFCGFEALCWSAFFSMRTRSSFASAMWAAAVLVLIVCVFEYVIAGPIWIQIVGYFARFALLGSIAARLIPQSDEWLHDFERRSTPSRLDWAIARSLGFIRESGRAVWLCWRENRTLIWLGLMALGIFALTAAYVLLIWRLDELERLARSASYRPISVFPLPRNFELTIASTVGLDLLFGAMGLVVFGTYRQQLALPMLVQQGASPRIRTMVRLGVFGGLIALILIALNVAFMLGTSRSDGFDGGTIYQWCAAIPLWCFVGCLWSSFHTNKKVVAFIAGVILAIAVATIQWVFMEFGIRPKFWKQTAFVWLGISVIGYVLLFAPRWAHAAWGRARRMVSWLLLPLAAMGIYGGAAAHRILDVPDVTTFDFRLPPLEDVPDVDVVTVTQLIDLQQVLGDRIDDPDLAKIFGRNASPTNPYIDRAKFQQWLEMDSSNVKWHAADLDREEWMYRVFRDLEPRLKALRDQLLSPQRVVFETTAGRLPQNEKVWFEVGVYAKLKENKPEESLDYIRALFRLEQNNSYYLVTKPIEIPTRLIGGDLETSALELLQIWVKHPSAASRPDLIEQAIHMVPEPGSDLPLAPYYVLRNRNYRKTQERPNQYFYDQHFPIDQRFRSIARWLVPWEAHRRDIMIDHAAQQSLHLLETGSPEERRRIVEEMRRYRNPFAGDFSWDFGPIDELREATKQVLERALTQAQSVQ